ncbi:hypothetical protein LSTR_LSTR009254 [Laodelphax striatellus]|uniref:G-protein coupled receptors family 1 profile domain-containing protein n=1 Tax=Laodelphax striatellus TaxID=195883 RepID=A0A482XD84_LAOST|nr:hypothetical protein LSTR_LSTR009254 [Laodelphax striatellus]
MEAAINSSAIPAQLAATRHLSVSGQVVITCFYVAGLAGNAAALAILCRGSWQPRNALHRLMLRCLAANDLTALLGMALQMHLQLYVPGIAQQLWFCRFRVLWRIFGLGSGCVAIVMAVERWFALTRPFFYQKYITLRVIRRAIFSLWAGTLLCVCIVCCNLAVMRALCRTNRSSKKQRVLTRRISRNQSLSYDACTREELAFARLMAILCVVFVLCWMPQMISIPMAQMNPNSYLSKMFFRTADILMALHFTLDPYIYVLQKWPLFRSLCSGKPSSRMNSLKTTQDNLVPH